MANGKVRVNVNAIYKDGEYLFKDMLVPARIQLIKIEKAPKFKEVALRLVVSDAIAEDLYESFNTSNHLDLNIEGCIPPLDRDNETRE